MFIPESEEKDIRIERTLNEDTGRIYLRYFYKRKQIPAFLLDSILSEQMAGYSMIEKDLSTVKEWLGLIDVILPDSYKNSSKGFVQAKERGIFQQVKALYIASLTFYAKCFTNCDGRRSKLNRKMLNIEYREHHDELMKYRNSFAAHSGRDKIEFGKTILVVNPKRNHELILTQQRAQPDLIFIADGIDFLAIVEHAIHVVKERQERLYEKLLEEIRSEDIQSFLAKCKKPKGIELALDRKSRG